MHVIVCGKVIPDPNVVTLEIDSSTKRMVRKDQPHVLDPAAASAVEEALRLTEEHGGSVTLVCMGIADAKDGVRRALAMGASAAIHLIDDAFAGSDTLGTAKALASAIKQEDYDLVICGTESSDSYSGIVPVQLAYLLGIPAVTFANKVAVEGDTLHVERQSETGFAKVTAELPALVSVTSGINEPRYPQLKGIMAARKIEIKTYSAGDLGLGAADVGASAARERVLTVGAPPQRGGGRVVQDEGDGGKQIADLLAELKVI
ncbi:MAG: Electron transfer flavoprotein alpha/beta-subunit [Chloroflexi bacterium]|nr:Electron transfer flavoprotein alpha/beta-subunit [Chloroflexota bacterium]